MDVANRKAGIQSGIFWGTCLVKYIEERSVITTSVLFYAAVKSQGLEEGRAKPLDDSDCFGIMFTTFKWPVRSQYSFINGIRH